MAGTGSSTKDLKRTLKFGDLMGIAVGQIIGAGVMVMSINALSMTGRSVNIAFVVAAVFTIIGQVPGIFIASVIRMRGGTYTQAAIFLGPTFAGWYMIIYIFSNMSIAMYATGLVSYIGYVFPTVMKYQNLVAAGIMTIFFILNLFGTEWMAKVQNFMFYLLIAALVIFTVFGVPKIQFAGYFGNELFGRPLFEGGFDGFFQAASYLTFATGGAQVIIQFSAEAVNPTKDIPIVMIISTLGVAILYALMSTVIGGVLPPEEVIPYQNLAPIAEVILPKALYYFFILCGACFALGTTLNASIGWVTKPLIQACEDGWFPRALGTLHPKYKSPMYLLGMFWAVNLIPLFLGWNIQQIGQWVLVLSRVSALALVLGTLRLPKLFPEQWEKSPYHVSNGLLYVLMIFAAAVTAFQAYMNLKGLAFGTAIVNLGICVAGMAYAMIMMKTGKVEMTVSYELD